MTRSRLSELLSSSTKFLRIAIASHWWLLPILTFVLLYSVIWTYWFAALGGSAWAPAWPAARTRLVLLVVSTPVWAATMLGLTLNAMFLRRIWQTWRQRLGFVKGYIEIHTDDEEAVSVRYNQRQFVRGRSRAYMQMSGYALVLLASLWVIGTYEQPSDIRYRTNIRKSIQHPNPKGYGTGEKVFIAAMFYNNENVLPTWTSEMIKVIHYIGTDNVFVSIVESNSHDATPSLLRSFDEQLESLNVPRRILIGDNSIKRPNSMETALPRIEFLAAVRNLALEPLVESGGYDRVLFSNDVLLTAESVIELLHTKAGEYDMACGLDLSFWGLYDAWVIRDRLGGLVSSLWPYIFEEGGMASIMADEPALVSTCWNGIVSIRADPLLPTHLRSVYSTSPSTAPPVAFRANRPDECFSSESFLLPYDLSRMHGADKIYVNPRVIVSYDRARYIWFKYVTRHWLVKWWIENVENGDGMHHAKMVVGDRSKVTRWDGGDCFPWW